MAPQVGQASMGACCASAAMGTNGMVDTPAVPVTATASSAHTWASERAGPD
jgi:hypothetical protein